MQPVVVRFTHPAWGLALPALLALVALSLVLAAWLSWRSRSFKVGAVAFLGALLAAGVAQLTWSRPIVPSPGVIHPYGAFLCGALLLAWWVAATLTRRLTLPTPLLPGVFVAITVGALLGGRLLFMMSDTGPIRWNDLFSLHHGGLSLWGSLAGGILALLIHCRSTGQNPWDWFGALVPASLVGIAVGRVGCFFSGADYGKALVGSHTDLLSGITTHARWSDDVMAFSAGPPVWLAQVEQHAISADRLISNPTHPVQLYEAFAVVLLLALAWPRAARVGRPGEVALLSSFGYVCVAFALEWLRGDLDRRLIGPALGGVWLPLALALALGFSLYWGLRGWTPRLAWKWTGVFVLTYALLMGAILAVAGRPEEPLRLSVAQCMALISAYACACAAHAFKQAQDSQRQSSADTRE